MSCIFSLGCDEFFISRPWFMDTSLRFASWGFSWSSVDILGLASGLLKGRSLLSLRQPLQSPAVQSLGLECSLPTTVGPKTECSSGDVPGTVVEGMKPVATLWEAWSTPGLKPLEREGVISPLVAVPLVAVPLVSVPLVSVVDLSMVERFGVRGPGAIAWLQSHSIPVPEVANSWVRLPDGGLIARLGIYEFLLEDTMGGSTLLNRLRRSGPLPDRVYPVTRSHGAIVLWGEAAPEVLAQACWTNGWRLEMGEQRVVVLNVGGVSVTLAMAEHQGLPFYYLWFDQPCGAYLCNLLVELAEGVGGCEVGMEKLFRCPIERTC
jgi:sarcosine oxidase, subunit gamma